MVSRMCRERGEDQGGDIEALPTVSPKPLIACRSLVASDASKYVFLCQRRHNSRQVDGLCSGANPRAAEGWKYLFILFVLLKLHPQQFREKEV